jgi:hypothetical protein
MSDDNKRGLEGRGPAGDFGESGRDDVSKTRSQTGMDTQGRSPDYDSDRLGDDGFRGGHATDNKSDMGNNRDMGGSMSTAMGGTTAGAMSSGSTSTSDFSDNSDGMGRDRSDTISADETGKLISSDKVVGTAVYNRDGDHLGTIYSVMIHKVSGRVAYAVMSFGGFLGIGERYHPLPWDVLTYDETKGGYDIDQSAEQLRSAPNYSREELDTLDYGQCGGEIRDYYGVGMGGAMGGMTGGLGRM